MTEESGFDIW